MALDRGATPPEGNWLTLDVTDPAAHRVVAERMQGKPLDMVKLGETYFGALNGQMMDQSKAFEWFVKAADLGFVRGTVLVAECLINGTGVKKSKVEGVAKFFVAAEAGSKADTGATKAKKPVKAVKH